MENFADEKWKDISNFEGLYQVSNLGRIKALQKTVIRNNSNVIRREKILKPRINSCGYEYINLTKCKNPKSFMVHRLVAFAYLYNPENKLEVNHINGVKNDNRAENIEWVTARENIRHSIEVLGNIKKGKAHKTHSSPKGREIGADYYINTFLQLCKHLNLHIGFSKKYRINPKGYSYNKKTNKYTALIRFQKKTYYLGEYKTSLEASNVYFKVIDLLSIKAS